MKSPVSLLYFLAVLALAMATGAGAAPSLAWAKDRAANDRAAEDKAGAPDLDQLFEALKAASTPLEIRTLEIKIRNSLQHTDSATIQLLMQRGRQAARAGDYDRALSHFSAVVDLAPAYPDGWFSRAIVYRKLDRLSEAVADIEWVVSLEPRHFQAWTELAEIFLDMGNDAGAYHAYKYALKADPHLEEARNAVKSLKPVVEGRGI